jgi:hypothetical protein
MLRSIASIATRAQFPEWAAWHAESHTESTHLGTRNRIPSHPDRQMSLVRQARPKIEAMLKMMTKANIRRRPIPLPSQGP